jgi:hypothetical protein
METRDDILNELRELAPGLAKLPLVNVFSVPQGYFEGFAGSVLRAVNGDTILKGIAQPENAGVPEGYFDTLAGSIMGKIKMQQATAEEEEQTLSPLLESLRHKNVFEVPAGYFDGLAGAVTAKLGEDDKEILPAVLQGLQTKNLFEVPQGYFENLADEITVKVKTAPAKLVKMSWLRVTKYAVAAAFAGAMALGVYKFTQPSQVILGSVYREGVALSKDENKYNAAFENVSDETIVKFLETSGQDVDAALAATAVDEKELPTEDDLLLDDKTLDNFLNDIDDKSLNN